MILTRVLLEKMKEDLVLDNNLDASAFPLSVFASLVGGEGLSEQSQERGAYSDSPSSPTSQSYYKGSGNFIVRRGTIGDFGSYSLIFWPSSQKTHNDPVLENTTSYWYETRNISLTDALYFYHSDHLGTPIAMTDTSGTLVWRAEHSPFGGIYALTVGTIANNLRFPGQYFDSETGTEKSQKDIGKISTGGK